MAKAFKIERRGRPKKPGKRYPSGDLVKEREVLEARIIAFRQPHRQSVPENVRHDPRAETLFGRMMLEGKISEVQYNAGVRYRKAVRRYRAHFIPEFPNPEPGSIGGYMQPTPPSRREPLDDKEERRIFDAREDAYIAILDAGGQRACKAVARVAVWDEQPAGFRWEDLEKGLNALISHYGLTRRN
jgi:hypothetical protein